MSINENNPNFSLKNVDIDILDNEFNEMKKKLEVFTDLKSGDKIIKTENNYWKCENDKYQQMTRWWYSENREKTIKYLDDEFKHFARLLDKVLYNLKEKHLLKYFTLAVDIAKYINDIILGLYSLKGTYINYKEMGLKVDSIITTLIDYKDQIDAYKHKERNRRHHMKSSVRINF